LKNYVKTTVNGEVTFNANYLLKSLATHHEKNERLGLRVNSICIMLSKIKPDIALIIYLSLFFMNLN